MNLHRRQVALNIAWAVVAACTAAVAAIEAAELSHWLIFVFTTLTVLGALVGAYYAWKTLRVLNR